MFAFLRNPLTMQLWKVGGTANGESIYSAALYL